MPRAFRRHNTATSNLDVELPRTLEEHMSHAVDFFYDWGAVHTAREAQSPGSKTAEPTAGIAGDLGIVRDPAGTLRIAYKNKDLIDFISAYQYFRNYLKDLESGEKRGNSGDDYDIISFLIDPNYLRSIGSGATPIFNSTKGIGLKARDNRAQWSSDRLLHHTHHCPPFTPRGLLHELGHLWLAYANYRDADKKPQRLLHKDFPFVTDPGEPQQEQAAFHWGRWVDHHNSCMSYDRHEWRRNGDGTYSSISQWADDGLGSYFGYWDLDQYLMGLIPPEMVNEWIILPNPKPKLPPANDLRSSGPYTADVKKVSVNDVIAHEGARDPDHQKSQRVFRQAFCVITNDAHDDTSFIRECRNVVQMHEANFRWATSGRGVVDTRLLRPNHADVFIRQHEDSKNRDTGLPGFRNSPDIWVRNANDRRAIHQSPLSRQSNWINVRVHNCGGGNYENVTVNIYAAASGRDFRYPEDWRPDRLIGSRTVPIPARDSAVVTIEWRPGLLPPEQYGTAVLLAELMPLDPKIKTLHNIQHSTKIAMKALAVVEPG
jgi:hypothetical protein